MSSKVKRKVTVENTKDNEEQPRRPSVFERLGPGAVNIASQPQERHSRTEQNEKCRNWLRSGTCSYGNTCRYQHEAFPNPQRREMKTEKDMEQKDLRHKVRIKKDPKDSRTGSVSPKRKESKRSGSRSRKGEHESKIKSTVVVTRPRSPSAPNPEPAEAKKKADGSWEDDSDDWPMDAAQLDYKEELTLERKRQQLQRELEIEIQKERLLNESVTITKTVSFSESSSSSSSSDSISSSSESSSSSSDDDSDETTSSSSSSSSSSRTKRKTKKPAKKTSQKVSVSKRREELDKSKVARGRSPSPVKKPASPRKNIRARGPRTPSPPKRQWSQSSLVEVRSAEIQRSRGKRHKKKRDVSRGEKHKGEHLSPPQLSSPNRSNLISGLPPKKSKQRSDSRTKSRHHRQDPTMGFLSRNSVSNVAQRQVSHTTDKAGDKYRSVDHSKFYSPREDELLPRSKGNEGRSKRSRLSPRKDNRKGSMSPPRYELELPRKVYSPFGEKEDRRRSPVSPRIDRRKTLGDLDKKGDLSPRREPPYHGYEKRKPKGKRMLSPEIKKQRDDRSRERKNRNMDYESASWSNDHPKSSANIRGTPEPHGRPDMRPQPGNRSRDPDRKKRKDRDISGRGGDEAERARLNSPGRSPLHVREIEPLTGNRGRVYEGDLPPGDYMYGYDPLHESYLLPPDYEQDVLCPPDLYPDSRYRRDASLKEPAPLMDRYSSRDVMSPRDVINLTGRGEDYIPDMPLDERGYEERWPRGRRDDWDPYAPLPPAPLPPHVAAALDEDRYGMPRRRRASPDWQRGRDDRDSNMGPVGHRQSGRGQMPVNEGKSRSPVAKGGNRPWVDRGGRHDSRNAENRHPDGPKDDRKGRSIRKERSKRKEDPSGVPREKGVKRVHSPSPLPKDMKRRKEDSNETLLTSEKGSSGKRIREDSKGDIKVARIIKAVKSEPSSPRSDVSRHSRLSSMETKNDSKSKDKEDRKSRRNEEKTQDDDDDFSDWSDGDDDLLNRDDFDSEMNNESTKSKVKVEEKSPVAPKLVEKLLSKELMGLSQRYKNHNGKNRESRPKMESTPKEVKPPIETKEADVTDSLSLREETATDVDEYITAESVDYDPISDDELDALIEEPDDSLIMTTSETEKSKIVDALDVNWSTLMNETKTEFVPGFARRRFKAAHVFSRIGFSQVLAGPELSEKIIKVCQKQLEDEQNENEGENKSAENEKVVKKFVMEHQIAAFHKAISQNKAERMNVFNQVGPFRRALCARRDLQIRKLLCKPVNKKHLLAFEAKFFHRLKNPQNFNHLKLASLSQKKSTKFRSRKQKEKNAKLSLARKKRRSAVFSSLKIRHYKLNSTAPVTYSPQYSVVDKDLYKQSIELLRLKKPEVQPQTVDVC